MTHICCRNCRLRFDSAAAAVLGACPDCGDPPEPLSLEVTFGFRLVTLEDVPQILPEAVAASLPLPDPSGARP